MVERLKGVLHGEHGLKSAAVLLMITLFLSNVLGLLRNILLATQADTLSQLDTYYAAFRLPDLVFNLLVLGSVSSAFIPVYADVLKNKGHKDANYLANTLLGTLVAVVIISIIILWFMVPTIIPILVSKFTYEQQQETIALARIMLLSPFFFSFSYVAGALLNAHKRFFSYAIAPLVYNLSIIIGALLLPYYGITAVAWAVVMGAFFHFLIQVPSLMHIGFRFRPHFDINNVDVHRIVRLMIPRTFSLGMAQLVLVGFTAIAALLSPGALTIFSLTNDFQTTPALLFGASMATAVFPLLAEAAAEKSFEEYRHYLQRTLRISFFVLIPLTILIYILRAQIIRLYMGLGPTVSWDETIRAINTLAWFSFSIAAQGITFIVARAFYALQDTKRPMYASLVGAAVTLGLAFYLPHMSYFSLSSRNDVAALAAAYSIGIWVQAGLLLRWLPKEWKGDMTPVWSRLVPILALTLISGVFTWITLQLIGGGIHFDEPVAVDVPGIGTTSVITLLIQGIVAGCVGGIVYVFLAKLMRMNELQWLVRWRKDTSHAKED